MGKRNFGKRPDADKKRAEQGRGQGEGAEWKPWLQGEEFPSKGFANRDPGRHGDRVHHLLSNLELSYFYALEWLDGVREVDEQYPLDLEETLGIAADFGVNHPADPATRQPIVMTTDFMIYLRGAPGARAARAVKPSQDLDKPRILEKLEIERVYWERRGVDWAIVTDRDIPLVLVKNAGWLRGHSSPTTLPVPKESVGIVGGTLRSLLLASPAAPLRDIVQECAGALGYGVGDVIAVLKHLIAAGLLKVDMFKAISLDSPLRVVSFEAPNSDQGGGHDAVNATAG